MGSKTVYYTIETNKSLDQIKEAMRRSFMMIGGTTAEMGDGFQIFQGTEGVNFAFAAKFDAMINIRQTSPTRYEFLGTVTWSPNTTFWVCLIAGFLLGIPWIINILYLFIDPSAAYQQALMRVQSMLN